MPNYPIGKAFQAEYEGSIPFTRSIPAKQKFIGRARKTLHGPSWRNIGSIYDVLVR
jgi:hypothetical protein